jgi:outer membrane protein OmpA-like peptidoglycan-associated protein
LAIGKWFTPGLGLRTKVNAWRLGSKPDGGGDPDQYWAANEQVLVNLSNLLMGYNEYRVWNFIPFFGAGINRNMSQDHYSTQLSFGLLNTFRISRRVWVNAEIGWNSWEANNTGIGLKKRHQQLTAELGLTFGLGKSRWKKVTDSGASNALLQGELDALNAQLEDALAENNRLQNELANQPKATAAVSTAAPKVVTKVVAAPVSVFFTVGKAVVSKKDLQNVSALAEVAKQNNAQLKVTGFADSKTGSAEYNQRLSQQRAEAVADALVQMGVERGQIEVVAAGGVDTLNPFDYNRRAVVEIK